MAVHFTYACEKCGRAALARVCALCVAAEHGVETDSPVDRIKAILVPPHPRR
jgi:hypothetical protein